VVALSLLHRIVAGDHRAVIKLADQGRIVLAAVGIDQQARKIGHGGGGSEPCREPARHGFDTDVIGDMAVELVRRQAKVAILFRKAAFGVVAQQHEPPGMVAFDQLKRGKGCCARHGLSGNVGRSSTKRRLAQSVMPRFGQCCRRGSAARCTPNQAV
jgi:hypothetical protein